MNFCSKPHEARAIVAKMVGRRAPLEAARKARE